LKFDAVLFDCDGVLVADDRVYWLDLACRGGYCGWAESHKSLLFAVQQRRRAQFKMAAGALARVSRWQP